MKHLIVVQTFQECGGARLNFIDENFNRVKYLDWIYQCPSIVDWMFTKKVKKDSYPEIDIHKLRQLSLHEINILELKNRELGLHTIFRSSAPRDDDDVCSRVIIPKLERPVTEDRVNILNSMRVDGKRNWKAGDIVELQLVQYGNRTIMDMRMTKDEIKSSLSEMYSDPNLCTRLADAISSFFDSGQDFISGERFARFIASAAFPDLEIAKVLLL